MLRRKGVKRAVEITAALTRDTISEEELARVAELQAAAWSAHTMASQAAAALERRIFHGAKVESGRWRWDAELRMVRTRDKASGE